MAQWDQYGLHQQLLVLMDGGQTRAAWAQLLSLCLFILTSSFKMIPLVYLHTCVNGVSPVGMDDGFNQGVKTSRDANFPFKLFHYVIAAVLNTLL